MPQALRRRVLLAYLGFPFYDTVTLPLLRGEGLLRPMQLPQGELVLEQKFQKVTGTLRSGKTEQQVEGRLRGDLTGSEVERF